jgi:hypothetical protein
MRDQMDNLAKRSKHQSFLGTSRVLSHAVHSTNLLLGASRTLLSSYSIGSPCVSSLSIYTATLFSSLTLSHSSPRQISVSYLQPPAPHRSGPSDPLGAQALPRHAFRRMV